MRLSLRESLESDMANEAEGMRVNVLEVAKVNEGGGGDKVLERGKGVRRMIRSKRSARVAVMPHMR